ncbi:MAG: pyridoxal-phosphate dependent enzyme [Kiritimatiellaceae bacterium]|nr:pyridoxal-phosphate dependent enzyme [Kiritimatiellaceae bacterium]
MNPLLQNFCVSPLSELPTPVTRLSSIGKVFGHPDLFIKQDNLSGKTYGGNKVRKLEFLLGEAVAEGRKSVITYGAAGSNHALATAICCRELGLKAISILAPQETSAHVRKNILMQHATGAELMLCPDFHDFPEATAQAIARCKKNDGIEPYIIPTGGTNAVGALGFVNAAFELIPQATRLPCPDVIYIPMGTGGTLAGLLVGLKLAGLKTRVEAIRVVEKEFRNETHIKQLCDELIENILSSQSPGNTEDQVKENFMPPYLRGKEIPVIKESDIIIRDEFFGEGYGIPTPEAEEAVELFQTLENVYLETTYTGKATAALLHDLRSGKLDHRTVLYWNTLNSRDFSSEIVNIDFHDLPAGFHPYFSCV